VEWNASGKGSKAKGARQREQGKESKAKGASQREQGKRAHKLISNSIL